MNIVIEAGSVDDLFVCLGTVFAEHIHAPSEGSPDRLPILLAGADLETLLEKFLEDLVYLAEFEGFAVRRVERITVENGEFRAAVSGRTTPSPSPPLIAPAAWNVQVLQADETWRARLVVVR